jgi:hypothetical protein
VSRFFSAEMVATVPAEYAKAHACDGASERVRGKHRVVDVTAEQTWVEVPLKPPCAGWAVAARIGLQENGALAISELRIFPREAPMLAGETGAHRPPGLWAGEVLGYRAPVPPGGLTSAVLRKIGLKWLLRFAASRVRGWERQVKEYYGALLKYGQAEGLVFEMPSPTRGHRGRPRLYDDAVLLRAARLYVEGLGREDSVHSVRRFVADALKVSPERARDLVKTARARGFLGRSTPGKLGGMLTPQAEALLAVQRKEPRKPTRRGARKTV